MAAGNSAFSLLGATPGISRPSGMSNFANNTSTTPYGAVLNGMQSSPVTPRPVTPLKKTTTTNVDGSSTTHEYHAPPPPGSPEAASKQQEKDMQTYFPGLIQNNGSTKPYNGGNESPNIQTIQSPSTSNTGINVPGQTNALGTATSGLINFGSTTNPVTSSASNALTANANNPTPAAPQIANLNNIAQNGSPQVQKAIADVSGLQKEQSEIANNPNIAAEVASGRGQAISGLISSAQTGVKNALDQQNQQITAGTNSGNLGLTGQGQQITAANEAGTMGNVSQGQNINALNNAGTLATPGNTTIQASPGNTVYQTGPDGKLQQVTNGVSSYANFSTLQQVQSLSSQYPDAVNSKGQRFNYDPSLTPQENADNFRDNYLPNSGIWQKSKFGVAGATSPNSAASISANAGSIGDLTTDLNKLSASRNSVANISNSLISQIAKNSNLNSSNISAINKAAQVIASNTSDPQYQTLLNQMTDIASTYGQILTPGGNTDSTRATAFSLINKLAQGSSIEEVIAGLDKQAYDKITGGQKTISDIQSGKNPNSPESQIKSIPSTSSVSPTSQSILDKYGIK